MNGGSLRDGGAPPVLIRDMTAADLARVLEIEGLSFSTPWSETSFLTELHNPASVAMVAEAEGLVIGYVCLKAILDEGHLLDLAVHPSIRNRGVARALMNEGLVRLRARGCTALYLEARLSNVAALRLYERLGFSHLGARKNYYTLPSEDAVLMVLDLTRAV